MKYLKKLFLLLLIVSLAAGCAAEPEETLPPVENTVPVTEPVTEMVTEPLPTFEALFGLDGAWIYRMAAGQAYDRPEDMDLNSLFYGGVDYPGSWGSISDTEQDLLMQAGFWRDMDIQIMPAALLEEKLQRYFGVGLDDVKIPRGWAYSPDTDTYYSNHNDALGCGATVTGHENLPDGSVLVHLTVDTVQAGEDWYWDTPMDMTLRPVDGVWQIVSNVFAQGAPAVEVRDLAYYQALMRWDSGFDYFLAAGSVFNTTEDLDLYHFFYNGVGIAAGWDMLNDEDRDLLLAASFRKDMDIQMLPGSVMEEKLQQYFGLGLGDFHIPAQWASDPETEVWYSNHNDAWVPQVTVTGFEEFEDGMVRLYMTVDLVMDHTGEYVSDADMVMTLDRLADGSFRIISNAFALDVV